MGELCIHYRNGGGPLANGFGSYVIELHKH